MLLLPHPSTAYPPPCPRRPSTHTRHAGPKALDASQPDLALTFELPGLEVSLVDHHPQELLALTVTDLKVVLLSGTNPSSGE